MLKRVGTSKFFSRSQRKSQTKAVQSQTIRLGAQTWKEHRYYVRDGCQPLMNYSKFVEMPAEIKAAIVGHLRGDRELLLVLCRVNKLFNELVTPLIYGDVVIKCPVIPGPHMLTGFRRDQRAVARQISYLFTTKRQPKYLAMARYLKWDFGAAIWEKFPSMTNLQSIDIVMRCTSFRAVTPVFPQLQKARLGGIFPHGGLQCIVLTSPFLTELHLIESVGEVVTLEDLQCPVVRSIVSFLKACVSTPGSLPLLKFLHISCPALDYTGDRIEGPWFVMERWARFLARFAPQLEYLELEMSGTVSDLLIDTRRPFNQSITPILKSGKFESLRRLSVTGGGIDEEVERQIFESLPSGSRFSSMAWRYGICRDYSNNTEHSLDPSSSTKPGSIDGESLYSS